MAYSQYSIYYQYESVVDRIKHQVKAEKNIVHKIELKEPERHLANELLAYFDNDKLYVEFIVGRRFPVKHFGYIYSQSGAIDENTFAYQRWKNTKSVAPNWFQF